MLRRGFLILLPGISLCLLPNFAHAQWQQMQGTKGISITSLIASGDTVLACGNGQIVRSVDQGAHWTKISGAINTPDVNLFLFHGSYVFGATTAAGLARSSDQGRTWEDANTGLTTYGITSIVAIGDTLFAGTDRSVFRSTNDGDLWTVADPTLTNTTGYYLAARGRTIIAAGGNAAVRSTDGGSTWMPIHAGLPDTAVVKCAFDGMNVIVVLHGSSVAYSMFSSTDAGSTWSRVANGPITNGQKTCLTFVNGVAYVFAGALWKSTNGGGAWIALPKNSQGDYYTSIVACGATLVAGAATNSSGELPQGGVYASTDGGTTWARTSLRDPGWFGYVGEMVIHHGVVIASGGYRSSDQGTTWKQFVSPGSILPLVHQDRLDVIRSYSTNSFQRSTDDGDTWLTIGSGLKGTNYRGLCDLGSDEFVLTDSGLFRLPDGSEIWEHVLVGSGSARLNWMLPCDTTLYVIAQGSTTPARSTNHGVTWDVLTAPFPFTTFTGYAAVGGASWMVYGNAGIYLTNDDGATWTACGNGIDSTHVQSICNVGATLFASGSNPFKEAFLYVSRDRGASWTLIDKSISDSYLWVAADNTYLYGGTLSAWVWRRPLSEFVSGVVQDEHPIPAQISLLGNYPNPFTAQTDIAFSLAHTDRATLTVYNELGREVATIAGDRFTAGVHRAMWNSAGLPNGIYTCCLRSGGFVATRVMVLAR